MKLNLINKLKGIKMKYVIWIIGLIIVGLRTFGYNIDITSIGLFLFLSIILLINDLGTLKEFSGLGTKFVFDNSSTEKLSYKMEQAEIKMQEHKSDKVSKIKDDKKGDAKEDKDWHNFNGDENLIDTDFVPYFDLSEPKIALISLASEIENIMLKISKNSLIKEQKFPISPKQIISELLTEKIIDIEIFESFNLFWDYRNIIIHKSDIKVTNSQILSIIDSGKRLYKILNTIKINSIIDMMK